MEGIAKAGYYPMLYAGFEEMNNYISSEVWNKYDIWFPHWAAKCGYTGKNLCMWQYGGETNKLESNSIPGVGVIDKNICYKDYPAIIKQQKHLLQGLPRHHQAGRLQRLDENRLDCIDYHKKDSNRGAAQTERC